MVLDNQNQHIQSVRSVLATAVYPIRVLIDAPSSFGRWLSENVSTRGTLLDDNRDLNDRILKQSARLQRMAALEAENARLRALLDSTAKVGDRVLIAEIMSVDMNPFRHKIVVNKGSSDEVYVGQALIDAQGVIGQVTRDQLYSAEALLITDIDHALPVELLRNQLRTIAVGTGDLEKLSLPFLPRNADVIEGDLLITSGLGGTFPPGYPVGTIEEVTSDSGEPFLKISARPSAGLNRIREVLLIWPQPTGAQLVDSERVDAESTADESPDLEASAATGARIDAAITEEPMTTDTVDDDTAGDDTADDDTAGDDTADDDTAATAEAATPDDEDAE
jgi:rod shape-determining protein MreC